MERSNKILIIDDNSAYTRLIAESFIDSGDEDIVPFLLFAENCDEALDMYVKHKPIMCIVDVKMPGISGPEIAYKIRQLDANAKIFFLTNYPGDLDAAKAVHDKIAIGIFGKENTGLVSSIMAFIIRVAMKAI